jgi:hypothetical protein
MKPLNIIGRKADNASVLAADTMLACELKNDSLRYRQHGAGEIARPHDGLKRRVGTNGHQAVFPVRSWLQSRRTMRGSPCM